MAEKALIRVRISHQRFGSLSVVLYLYYTSYEPLITDITPFYRLFEITLNYIIRVRISNMLSKSQLDSPGPSIL